MPEAAEPAAEVNSLRREVEQLRARLADAEGEGCTLHKHAPHGKEAEELRKGVETVLRGSLTAAEAVRLADVGPDARVVSAAALQRLLDRVGARDSLSHLRANEELRDARKALNRHGRTWARIYEVLVEAWLNHLEDPDGIPQHLKDALRTLGVKLNTLPKPIPPAGERLPRAPRRRATNGAGYRRKADG